MRICGVRGCKNKGLYRFKKRGKFLCDKHYQQIRLYGKILKQTIYDKNEIIVLDDHAEIILYNVKHQEVGRAKIDLEDIEKVKKFKWRLNNQGYVLTKFQNKHIRLHHLFIGKPINDLEVDHINGNPSDNRKQNLRICSHSENLMNKRMMKNNTSGIVGVCWDKLTKKWVVYISINKKLKHLGRFQDKQKAINIRKQAEQKYYGKFAVNH